MASQSESHRNRVLICFFNASPNAVVNCCPVSRQASMLVISCELELESELDLDHIKALITHTNTQTHTHTPIMLLMNWTGCKVVLYVGIRVRLLRLTAHFFTCSSESRRALWLLNNAVRKGEGKNASSCAKKSMHSRQSSANIILKNCLIHAEVLWIPNSFCL